MTKLHDTIESMVPMLRGIASRCTTAEDSNTIHSMIQALRNAVRAEENQYKAGLKFALDLLDKVDWDHAASAVQVIAAISKEATK